MINKSLHMASEAQVFPIVFIWVIILVLCSVTFMSFLYLSKLRYQYHLKLKLTFKKIQDASKSFLFLKALSKDAYDNW